jgi:hypothetical protein
MKNCRSILPLPYIKPTLSDWKYIFYPQWATGSMALAINPMRSTMRPLTTATGWMLLTCCVTTPPQRSPIAERHEHAYPELSFTTLNR